MRIVKEGTSKKGTPYLIRYIERNDTEDAWRYINELSKEKTFVRLQGEEVTIEKEREQVEKWVTGIEEGKTVVLVLVADGKLSGICNAAVKGRTESHVAGMGLSIGAGIRGEGLGRELFQAAIDEAIKTIAGLRILALEVKEPNDTGIALYKSCGFIEFGRLPLGSTHRGEYVDEIFMYKPVQ